MRRYMLAMALAVAGCDGGGSGGETKSIKVTGESDYDAQLKSLSEFNRGLGLRRAVLDSGARCKSVDFSGYQQAYRNMSMWTVRCSDGGDYALFIAPNADVQVRKCGDAGQLKLPECRFEAEPAKLPAKAPPEAPAQ